MAISEVDLPRIIIERLEACHPAPAIFTSDEIADWPDDVFTGLQASGLLQQADRADFVICDGCHWGCHKPVVFRRGPAGARAFIVCDEEPDLGRIGVPIERLWQHRSTLSLLAHFLRNSFGLTARAPLSGPPPLFLGRVKGRHGEQGVSLLLDDGRIVLRIGAHWKSLGEFLAFRQSRITANTPGAIARFDVVRARAGREGINPEFFSIFFGLGTVTLNGWHAETWSFAMDFMAGLSFCGRRSALPISVQTG